MNKNLLHFFIILVGLGIIYAGLNYLTNLYEGEYDDVFSYDYGYNDYNYDGCSVAGIELHGTLLTYYPIDYQGIDDIASSETIIDALARAEDTDSVEVILFEVDSYGGAPVAAHELEEYIRRSVAKPVVVHIREAADSAAYWAASAGDILFASEISEVGSIGITQSYIDASIQNEEVGITYNQLSVGKFKDTLSPDKPLTDEERQLIERDLELIYDKFVADVATNRNLSLDQALALADGSTMLGLQAREEGLIDRIGTHTDVREYLESIITTPLAVCW